MTLTVKLTLTDTPGLELPIGGNLMVPVLVKASFFPG